MSEWNFIINTAIPVLVSVIPWMIRVHAKLAVVEHQIRELCTRLDTNAESARDLAARSNEISSRVHKMEELLIYRTAKRSKQEPITR